MKRYFSLVETVRIKYEHKTNDKDESEIENIYDGNYYRWLKDKDIPMMFADGTLEYNSIVDYIDVNLESAMEEGEFNE